VKEKLLEWLAKLYGVLPFWKWGSLECDICKFQRELQLPVLFAIL
jgi:hypothetical protein